jgi:hypothetical protein
MESDIDGTTHDMCATQTPSTPLLLRLSARGHCATHGIGLLEDVVVGTTEMPHFQY